jgi:ribosomal-protein-alanine N-acetyltransferase
VSVSVRDVPTLVGRRCTLRPLLPSDAPAIARHADDEGVVRNLFDGFPHPYTLAHAEAWCGHEHREYGHSFAIEVGGEAIGCLGINPQQGFLACNAMLGYWIGRAHWGRGIVVDGVLMATAWAWAELPAVTRLFAPIFARNRASQRVAEKAGYVREALLPRSMLKDGVAIDIVQYASYRESPHG